MNYGDLDAVKWLQSVLEKEFIRSVVLKSRNLTPKTKNYWELILNIKRDRLTNHGRRASIDDFVHYNGVRLADMRDIASMKLEAIAGRGSKKDFVDLYFLLNHFSLEEIFSFHALKYGIGLNNQYHHLKSLVYFADADSDAMPLMTSPLKWDSVKSRIRSCVSQLQKSL